MFVCKPKTIKNTMRFSHLFILQLKSWLCGPKPPDLDFELDFFWLFVLVTNWYLLIFASANLWLLASASTSFDFFARANTSEYAGPIRQCNFYWWLNCFWTSQISKINFIGINILKSGFLAVFSSTSDGCTSGFIIV